MYTGQTHTYTERSETSHSRGAKDRRKERRSCIARACREGHIGNARERRKKKRPFKKAEREKVK